MWTVTALGMLCVVGIEFYVRFLIALSKEYRRQCKCYLVHVRPGVAEIEVAEEQVSRQMPVDDDRLFCKQRRIA